MHFRIRSKDFPKLLTTDRLSPPVARQVEIGNLLRTNVDGASSVISLKAEPNWTQNRMAALDFTVKIFKQPSPEGIFLPHPRPKWPGGREIAFA